jgi:hypothetical protein
MTAEDLIELRDYAKSLGFCIFEHWREDEFTVAMPQFKKFDCCNWIIDCTYNSKKHIDIINKCGIEHLMKRKEINKYRTYRVEYLNLKTMKRWLDLMLVISKKYNMKQKLKNIEKDFV